MISEKKIRKRILNSVGELGNMKLKVCKSYLRIWFGEKIRM